VLDLPAAQQLSSDDVEQLLLAALGSEDTETVSLLCQHAIAGKLSPSAVGRLLAAAVQLCASSAALHSVLSLLRLGTASVSMHFHMEHLVPAIRAAVCFSDTNCCMGYGATAATAGHVIVSPADVAQRVATGGPGTPAAVAAAGPGATGVH
jgi:hypothetical protein